MKARSVTKTSRNVFATISICGLASTWYCNMQHPTMLTVSSPIEKFALFIGEQFINEVTTAVFYLFVITLSPLLLVPPRQTTLGELGAISWHHLTLLVAAAFSIPLFLSMQKQSTERTPPAVSVAFSACCVLAIPAVTDLLGAEVRQSPYWKSASSLW